MNITQRLFFCYYFFFFFTKYSGDMQNISTRNLVRYSTKKKDQAHHWVVFLNAWLLYQFIILFERIYFLPAV